MDDNRERLSRGGFHCRGPNVPSQVDGSSSRDAGRLDPIRPDETRPSCAAVHYIMRARCVRYVSARLFR